MKDKKVKQSVVAGALTGSAGIFITKALSLLYVIPFNQIAQDATVFYSYAYTVYDAVLQLCLSGLPYAIATLVSRYSTLNDNGTVLLVKKISRTLVTVFGVVACVFMITFSRPLALQIIPFELQSSDYIVKTQNVLIIVSFALVFVPILSYYRGFYQGLKELKVYAFTQVFEQIVRIGFLLSASCIAVYAFNMDRVWAAYMGVASTGISAVAAIIYFISFDKNYSQENFVEVGVSRYTKKHITKELIRTAVPYMLSALMLSSSGMFVLLMFANGLEKFGTDPVLITVYQGIINYQASKLSSIPMIFMSGFCLAIIPHMTEAVTNNDDKGARVQIQRILETVNFFSVPIICFMVFFSKEIYYIMYGNYYLLVGADLLAKTLICQLFLNIFGIVQSTLITIGQRKLYLVLEAGRLVFVLLLFAPMLSNFGVNGYFITLFLEYVLFIIGGLYIINYRYNLDFSELFNNCSKAWICCIPMFVIVAVFNQFNYDVVLNSRFMILIITGIIFVACVGLYGLIAQKTGIVNELLGINLDKDFFMSLINRVLKKARKSEE